MASLLTLDTGATCSSWNYCGQRLASGSADGTLSIFNPRDPAASSASSLSCTSKFRVNEGSILKVAWAPPEYGDVVACVCADGTLSLWEEVAEDAQPPQWIMCKTFGSSSSKVLDIEFSVSLSTLKMVAAYSDGCVKVFELLDPLELRNWQLQVWEFDQAHQRWLPVAELALPEDKGDRVYAVAWAPNIGRQYEVIAVGTEKGISIWHLGLNPDQDGRLPVEKVASLSGHGGEVWQMEWDMSGMTLASTGHDGMVRLWQCNLYGVWHEQASFELTS